QVQSYCSRKPVCGECARITAKHVARKLVVKQNERESCARSFLPVSEFVLRRLLVVREEAVFDGLVSSRVGAKPQAATLVVILSVVLQLTKPKGKNFVRVRHA